MEVGKDFASRRKLLANDSASFGVFGRHLTTEEREAMEFIYAYSPLGDITLHDGDYFYRNVRQTFEARRRMPWGDSIPEYIFRHYVMPLRINNESLDMSRVDFYDELCKRVAGKSMEQAALEVNHWCHEHVNYQPTDARTASPEALMKRAYGRCGEETVFAAAALRSVCIPARQVYTPRWAHCDDNHAWLEVWIDGKWHYMGACEPAPRLDEAWFTYSAGRGLYMEVKVFGKYSGEEDIVIQDSLVARINATANYAPVARPAVKAVDVEGKPVAGAYVFYKVYNYAEYHTVFTGKTDSRGEACFSMGKGDWIIRVSDPATQNYGIVEANPSDTSVIVVALDRKEGDEYFERHEIVPPAGTPFPRDMDSPEERRNRERIAHEDTIREAFVSAFPKSCSEAMSRYDFESASDTSGMKSVMLGDRSVFDPSVLDRAVKVSCGNWRMIPEVLNGAALAGRRYLAIAVSLLNSLCDKDLQDAEADVLVSHTLWYGTDSCRAGYDPAFAASYIVSPRIGTEELTSWRKAVSGWLGSHGAGNADELAEAVRSMRVDNSTTRGDVFMTPEAVARFGVCDSVSREMFYVAAARTLRIPSRLSPVDGKPQIFEDGKWITVELGKGIEHDPSDYGSLMLTCKGGAVEDPQYYINFTLSKLEGGRMRLLDLGGSSEGDMGDNLRCSHIFREPVRLESGNYFLVTGNRRSDGSVVSSIRSFNIEKGKERDLDFRIESAASLPVGYIPAAEAAKLFGGKGYSVVLLLASGSEPSTHLMNDFAVMRGDFERVKAPFRVYCDDRKSAAEAENGMLPGNAVYGVDEGGSIFEELTSKLHLQREYPVVVIGNAEGEIAYASSGYGINQGVRILKYF
jgi:hypothetical protein